MQPMSCVMLFGISLRFKVQLFRGGSQHERQAHPREMQEVLSGLGCCCSRRSRPRMVRDFPRVRLSLIAYQLALGPSLGACPCSLLRPNFQQEY